MQDQVRPTPLSPHCPCRTGLRSKLFYLYFYGRGSLDEAEGSRFFQADTKILRPSPLTLREIIHQVIKIWPTHRDTAPSKAGTHGAAVCNNSLYTQLCCYSHPPTLMWKLTSPGTKMCSGVFPMIQLLLSLVWEGSRRAQHPKALTQHPWLLQCWSEIGFLSMTTCC